MQEQLEALVDQFGLFAVLDNLSDVCGLKVEHVTSNWQDADLAKEWRAAETAIDAAASKVLDLNLVLAGRK